MKKYQIFVSSTYLDLIDERAQVTKAILEIGHIPVGMEMFSASDETQWKLIQRQIDDCDYYVVVVAHKYGSRDTDGRSYTEKEYDYAISKGIPVLGFVIENGAPWQPTKMDKDVDLISLNLFKDKVKSKMVKMWSNKEALHAAIVASLSIYFTLNPRVGWIKASEGADSSVLNEVSRLSSENAELRKQLEEQSNSLNNIHNEKRDYTIELLKKNTADLAIKSVGQMVFGDGPIITYEQAFRILAPLLVHDQNLDHCTKFLAYGAITKADGKVPAEEYPIPLNVINRILGNLIILELLESFSDTGEIIYTLTDFGTEVYRHLILSDFAK